MKLSCMKWNIIKSFRKNISIDTYHSKGSAIKLFKMKKKNLTVTMLVLLIMLSCTPEKRENCFSVQGEQSKVIVSMIEAVNKRNAEKYVTRFAKDVQILVDDSIKINGRDALQVNRARHFKAFPNLCSEIQNLVEIDDKVIMHDKVWLDELDKEGQDIVEIFTFKEGKVIKVEVIQSKDFFKD